MNINFKDLQKKKYFQFLNVTFQIEINILIQIKANDTDFLEFFVLEEFFGIKLLSVSENIATLNGDVLVS